MNLYKIAAQKKDQDKSKVSSLANSGIYAATSLGIPLVTALPVLAFDANKSDNSHNIDKVFKHYENKYKDSMDKLHQTGIIENTNSVVHSGAIPEQFQHEIFGQKIHGVLFPKHAPESIVAHELSHYNNFLFKNKNWYQAGKFSPLATTAAAALNRTDDKDKQKKINLAIGTAGTMMSLPMLAEESKANLEALKAIRQIHGKVGVKNLIALAGSQAGYMGHAFAPLIGTVLANKYIDKKNKA